MVKLKLNMLVIKFDLINMLMPLSYNKEIMVKNNEEIPKNELDKIINGMNGTLFKIEEFTKKHNIDLF